MKFFSIVLVFLCFFLLSHGIDGHNLREYHPSPLPHDLKNYHQSGLENNISYSQLYPKSVNQLHLKSVIGPESIVFDCNNAGPYTGVSDGRILKWQGVQVGWTEFATTAPNRSRKLCDGSTNATIEPLCGRPLGLRFDPRTCDLYITDAYYGLMVVGAGGGPAKQLVSSAEGIPFRYTNALDIDTNTGVVYFTDSSLFFQRSQFLLPILTGDRTGRLLKYDPSTQQTEVMYRGLAYANGVAVSKDNSNLVVAETTPKRIFRFWLHDQGETRNYYTPEFFAQVLSFPDNIERNNNGEFWVALNIANEGGNEPVGVKYDEMGNVIAVLYENSQDALGFVSDIVEHDGKLYLGSPLQPYVRVIEV